MPETFTNHLGLVLHSYLLIIVCVLDDFVWRRPGNPHVAVHAVQQAAAPPPREHQSTAWVDRWLPGGSGGGLAWVWVGGLEVVRLYPRAPVPRGGATLEAESLAPQAALAVERRGPLSAQTPDSAA